MRIFWPFYDWFYPYVRCCKILSIPMKTVWSNLYVLYTYRPSCRITQVSQPGIADFAGWSTFNGSCLYRAERYYAIQRFIFWSFKFFIDTSHHAKWFVFIKIKEFYKYFRALSCKKWCLKVVAEYSYKY